MRKQPWFNLIPYH